MASDIEFIGNTGVVQHNVVPRGSHTDRVRFIRESIIVLSLLSSNAVMLTTTGHSGRNGSTSEPGL